MSRIPSVMLQRSLEIYLNLTCIGSYYLKALFMASSFPRCVYLLHSTRLLIGQTQRHCLAIKAATR